MIYHFKNKTPDLNSCLFIAPNAAVIGDVVLGDDTSVWFGASIRGDEAPVRIGSGTNVQDNASLHVAENIPLIVGERVTIGHNAVLHGCKVGNDSLIGIGAIVLNNAEIGEESIVGAGALVTEGKTFPRRSLIVGSPAKAVKCLSDDDVKAIRKNGDVYIQLAKDTASSNAES